MDRIAMAFGSAVLAFPLSFLVWFKFLGYFPRLAEIAPLKGVFVFTGVMAALGFLLAENLIVYPLIVLIELIHPREK